MAEKPNKRDTPLERDPYLETDNQAQMDELGSDPGQVGPDSAGQSGDSQGLSSTEDVNEESVEELAEAEQPFESAAVEGVEDAEDHPERPTHTHEEYGRPDDVPPKRNVA
ncbi:MAG: hypothetical protein WA824_06180 [Candidatus Sulfotelmatobacter sp.]